MAGVGLQSVEGDRWLEKEFTQGRVLYFGGSGVVANERRSNASRCCACRFLRERRSGET
jgi:hypothetical protein